MKFRLRLVCVLACFLATRDLVSGSVLARPGELPYVVGIIRVTGELGVCTGGIIDEKFIITAAHCLADVVKEYDDGTCTSEFVDSQVLVYANTTKFLTDVRDEIQSGENRTSTLTTRKAVKAYFVSEYFKNGLDDIAILELESPLNLKDGYHRKLKLPTGRKISYKGVDALLAGFGDRVEGSSVDDNLKKTHFRVVPYSKCQYPAAEIYRRNSLCLTPVTEDNEHSNDLFVACDGDSGGPIVHGNTVIGIMTSVSEVTCDDRNAYPQIILNVRYYKDFIKNVIQNRHRRPDNKQSITEFKLRL